MFGWLSRFFTWLPRRVKQVNVLGFGVELREPLMSDKAPPKPVLPTARQTEGAPRVEQREDYISVAGTSASSHLTPREIDLMADGDEIQFHIHQLGGNQSKLRVGRVALEEAFTRWKQMGGEEITVPAKTSHRGAEKQVTFALDNSDTVEVRAGWWIWVSKHDLEAALAALGVRAPPW